MQCIYYKSGYKFQLQRDYIEVINFKPEQAINTKFIELAVDGKIKLAHGYAWDGASGPTFNTPNLMRGLLIHDALYQLMREGYLYRDKHRKAAD